MQCETNCGRPATLHITELLEDRLRLVELHLCEDCAHHHLYGGRVRLSPIRPDSRTTQSTEVQIELVRIIISEIHEQQVIVLQEVDGERAFSIMTGIFEASTLDWTLKQLPTPRPLTHDAWFSSVAQMGGRIESVCITSLRDHTYFSAIRVSLDGRLVEIDVRPSDAVIMALKAGAPLLVTEAILAEVCG